MSGKIIDIHSHILPGVDDGAVDWGESRRMLELAYEQGIRTIIATPHFSRRQEVEKLRELVSQLDTEARKIDTEYRICSGQELMYFDSLDDYLKRGKALTLADSRYILVEFMPQAVYRNIYQGIRKLLMAGYVPVLAHVERYHALRKEGGLEELKTAGCYFQVNYDSLEASFFDSNTRWCKKRIMGNEIHFLSTDMHRKDHRAPVIQKGLNWLKRNCSPEQFERLTWKNAECIMTDRPFT